VIEITSIVETKKHIQGIKAIVFDLDDTLYSEKEYVRSGFRAIAETMPQIKQMEKKLWKSFEQKKTAIDEVLSAEGIYTDELKQECLSVYRFHQPDIHLYDNVKELLQQFRADGYKLGIITDGRPEGQRAKIKALGLGELVDYIIVTDELGGVEYRKPHEAAFVKMSETLGVAFDEMCYIGDNLKKDLVAPEMLGIRAIHFANTDGLYSM